jgi:hypothetical protein
VISTLGHARLGLLYQADGSEDGWSCTKKAILWVL